MTDKSISTNRHKWCRDIDNGTSATDWCMNECLIIDGSRSSKQRPENKFKFYEVLL